MKAAAKKGAVRGKRGKPAKKAPPADRAYKNAKPPVAPRAKALRPEDSKRIDPKLAADSAVRTSVKSAAPATEPIETTIARVLGEAHEPVTLAEIHKATLRAGHRRSELEVQERCDAMVGKGLAVRAPGNWPHYWTPDTAPKPNLFAEKLKTDVSPELSWRGPHIFTGQSHVADDDRGPMWSRDVPTTPERALLAAIARAPRKKLRLRTPLTVEKRALYQDARDSCARLVDDLSTKLASARKSVIETNKVLRAGVEVRTVETVSVPDYPHRQLVTFDVSGPEPVEMSRRPLPRKYGVAPAEQTSITFPAPEGGA